MSQTLSKKQSKEDPLSTLLDIFEKGNSKKDTLMKNACKARISDILSKKPVEIESNISIESSLELDSLKIKG